MKSERWLWTKVSTPEWFPAWRTLWLSIWTWPTKSSIGQTSPKRRSTGERGWNQNEFGFFVPYTPNGCKLFFFNPELKRTWLKTPVITSQSLVVTLMLLKASLLTGSTATCTGLTAFAAPSQWLLLTEAVGKLFSTETCQNPVLLWSTPAASKSNSMTREDNRMAIIFLWAYAQGENKPSGKV